MRARRFSIAALLAITASLCAVEASAAEESVVTIAEGKLRGRVEGKLRTFFGIPFAEPPVGARRWTPPQSIKPWTGVRAAEAKGSPCVQLPRAGQPVAGSEDCLYLDVYAPTVESGRKLPVFVYFYGGSMVTGSSREIDASLLAEREQVVVVVPNYRLGVFGYTTLPELDRESPSGTSGNYGLLDQQEALRWVQRNIAAFGGDAGAVTIGGQSAGGYSVGVHMLSPDSAPLFHRAIVMGMPFIDATSILTMPGYVSNQWEQRAGPSSYLPFLANCGQEKDRLACLRSRSTAEIAAAIAGKPDMTWSPTIDGLLRKDLPPRMVERGEYKAVPMLMGANQNEGGLNVLYFRTAAGRAMNARDYRNEVLALEHGQKMLERFALPVDGDPEQAFAAIRTGTVNCRLARNAALFSRRAPVFVYLFADEEAPGLGYEPPGFKGGSYHAAEIQYVFGRGYPNSRQPGPPPFKEAQKRLSDRMIGYWGRFIREGRPAPDSVWPEFSAQRSILRLEPGDADRLSPLEEFRSQFSCDFWDGLDRPR